MHVDGVTERLEGVEGYANGEDDVQRSKPLNSEDDGKGIQKEVEILEKAENNKRDYNCDVKIDLPAA